MSDMPVHKAAPGTRNDRCAVCGQPVKRVPGGQGPTWVHSDSGAVAAPNPPAQATHQLCPEDPAGGSHHLVPKAGVMTCEYCGKTQAELEGR